MKDGKYDLALQTIQTIITHDSSVNKIPPLFDKIKCHMEIGQIDEAKNSLTDLVNMIDSKLPSDQLTVITDEFDEKIKSIIIKFVECRRIDTAVALVKCRFKLVIAFFTGESRLWKLKNIGYLMKEIAIQLSNQQKPDKIRQNYSLMDKILKEMQKINDVDMKLKCRQVTWFLMRYGFCCNEAKDWMKSIEIHKQAIVVMETAFAEEATRCQVLGNCYNNLGVAYKNCNRLDEAKVCYQRAIEIFNKANDHSNSDVRDELITSSSQNLHYVQEKLA